MIGTDDREREKENKPGKRKRETLIFIMVLCRLEQAAPSLSGVDCIDNRDPLILWFGSLMYTYTFQV